jgi:2-methylcitrate dehydratase PrpD
MGQTGVARMCEENGGPHAIPPGAKPAAAVDMSPVTHAGKPGSSRTRNLQQLTRRLSNLRIDDIPPAAHRMIRLCLLDALGNMVAAAGLPESLGIGRLGGPIPGGRASVFGWNRRLAALPAAFHNAVHVDLLEAQDGHRRAGLHPSEGAIPAALALAETDGASWGDLLSAIVAGYEVAIRFGTALFPEQIRAGFYPDGTCGPLGAAAAASRLRGSDGPTMARALATAAFAVPLSLVQDMRSAAKPLIAGMGAELGLRAAEWAAAGFGGDLAAFDPPNGFLEKLSPHPHPRRLERGPAKRWAIEEVYLKPYPGGRHAHAAVDAVREVLKDRPTNPRTIRSIEVRTYRAAVTLTGSIPGPHSPLAELTQSTPYLVAAGVRDGVIGPERFHSNRRADRAILALARRVRLVEDPSWTRSYPRTTTARVTVEFRDGRRSIATIRHRWGDPEQPMTVEEVRAKFVRSVAYRASGPTACRLWDSIWGASPDDDVPRLLHEFAETVSPVHRRRPKTPRT